MISNEMLNLGKKRSIIRDIFEYGATRKKEIGAENVYDFSLGNPSIPAPDCVNEAIKELLEKEDSIRLHSYTSAQGDLNVRKTISDSINNKYSTNLSPDNIYMTVGAAASLSISLKALAVPGDEFIVFTPFFPEYRVFIQNAGGTPVVVKSNEDDFQIDINNLIEAITPKTKAVLINSPNNPSGVIISEESIKSLCKVLEEKSNEYGHPIYLIADEPYRELVYDDIEVPYLTKYYANTFVCYSFSKSLSLPGERIGYIVVSNEMENWQDVIAKCIGQTADISVYKKNRDILYNGLTKLGYTCVKPDGAFYLFVKSMEPDAYAFYEKAKKHELLIVPADDFGAPGYVRISYCVTTEQIENSMPAFEKLAKEYK